MNMVPTITTNALAVTLISSLLILILTRAFLRWRSLRPTKQEILASQKERIVELQERLTLLIARLTWTTPQELEIRSRHRGLALTALDALYARSLCSHMISCLSKAISYYPEDIRREIGGVEAAQNMERIKKDKTKYRAPKGKSANQTARALKAEEWK